MKFGEFIVAALRSDSGVSSKRLSGFIGWVFCMVAIAYLCVTGKESPAILDTFLICSASLLGLDTVMTAINSFRKGNIDKSLDKTVDKTK